MATETQNQPHKFITEEGLKRLDEYKYVSGGYSWLDNKMNPFWVFFVDNLVPDWMAPNLMTTLGFFFMSLSYFIMLFFDCSLTEDVPSWTYFFAGICIFIYQTLDACDGKQARKTKSSSPLGQLVDHGCDSFALNFMFLTVMQATGIPRFHIIFCYINMQYVFWTSQWLENHTKVLKTNVGNLGVTEIEILLILFHFITGIFGREVWKSSTRPFLPNFLSQWIEGRFSFGKELIDQPIYQYVYWTIVASMIVITFIMIFSILLTKDNKVEQIAQFLPVTAVVLLEILIYQIPVLREKYLGLVLISFGIFFSFICCKMIICSMTDMKFKLFQRELIVPFILTVFLYFFHDILDDRIIVLIFLGIIFVIVGTIYWFLHGVITQITAHIGIYCFTLKKREKTS